MLEKGFLGYDTTFMLDLVVCALVLVVPLVIYSLVTVRGRSYTRHKNLQIALAGVLLVTVLLFEIDVQFLHGGWRNIVNKPGGPPRRSATELAEIQTALWVHLVFAVSTPFLWAATLYGALRKFPDPPRPGPYSLTHRRLGWLATVDLVLTSVTGLIFYFLAFIRAAAA